MSLIRSFPLTNREKIKILILGKKELPPASMEVQTQRSEISKRIGVSESSVYLLNQVHGDGVVDLKTSKNLSFPEGDAWIGEELNQILCIKTADCMPLFFGLLKVLSL